MAATPPLLPLIANSSGYVEELPLGQNIITPLPMNRTIVLEGEHFLIPQYYQAHVFRDMTMNGEITIEGELCFI